MSKSDHLQHQQAGREVGERRAPMQWRLFRRSIAVSAFIAHVAIASAPTHDSPSENQPKPCVSRAVDFTGVHRLDYAHVHAEGNRAEPLLAVYPPSCPSRQESSCVATRQVPNDTEVAIGKTCGHWSFVQHIGDSAVDYGWIRATRLVPLARRLPDDEGRPEDMSDGLESMQGFSTRRMRFRLSSGNGIPVCEAYLQRLNQTVFHQRPACGRPENDQIPGFARLHRVPLSPETISALAIHAEWFVFTGEENSRLLQQAITEHVALLGAVNKFSTVAWTYDRALDLTNDDRPVHIVIWGGQPLPGGDPAPACGLDSQDGRGRETGEQRRAQIALILDRTGKGIDAEATTKRFALSATEAPRRDFETWVYKPREPYIGIFSYRGVYYTDTFYDPGVHDRDIPRGPYFLPSTHLAVNRRVGADVQTMCTYELRN